MDSLRKLALDLKLDESQLPALLEELEKRFPPVAAPLPVLEHDLQELL